MKLEAVEQGVAGSSTQGRAVDTKLPSRMRAQWGLWLGIALLVGFLAAGWLAHGQPWTVEEDGLAFLQGARTIGTEHYVMTWSPGTAFAFWLVARAGLDLFTAAKLVMAIAALVFLVSSYFVFRFVLGSGPANWAVLILLASYTMLADGVVLGSHMPAAALGMMGLLFFLYRKNRAALILSGLCFGLAVDLRINYVILLGLGILLVIGAGERRDKLVALCLWGGVFVLAFAPLIAVTTAAEGGTLNTGQWQRAPESLLGAGAAAGFASPLDFVLSNPAYLAVRYGLRLAFDLPTYLATAFAWIGMIGLAGLCLALVFGLQTRKTLPRAGWEVVLLGFGLFLVPLAAAPLNRSYLLFALPLLIAGAVWSIGLAAGTNRMLAGAAAGVLCLLTLVDAAHNLGFNYRLVREAPDYEGAAAYVAQSAARSARVLLIGQDFFSFYVPNIQLTDCRGMVDDKLRYEYVLFDERFKAQRDECLARAGLDPEMLRPVFRSAGANAIEMYAVNR